MRKKRKILQFSIIITLLLIIALLFAWYVSFSKKSKEKISKAGKYGPVVGSFLGAIPQCGFSVMATNLYVTRIISLGTLIAIYLSTSDEMIPILLADGSSFKTIALILSIKFIVGMLSGYLIDLFLRKQKKPKEDYEICENENCHCEKSLLVSSLILSITFSILNILSPNF